MFGLWLIVMNMFCICRFFVVLVFMFLMCRFVMFDFLFVILLSM